MPWLRVAAGLTIAVFIASVWRPSEFPDSFPGADVAFVDGARAKGETEPVCGLYLGSTSDAIILAKTSPCGATRVKTSTAIVIARSKVAQITLTKTPLLPPSPSLLRRLLGVELECIPPVCQRGRTRYIILQPFSGEETACADDDKSADCDQHAVARTRLRRRVS